MKRLFFLILFCCCFWGLNGQAPGNGAYDTVQVIEHEGEHIVVNPDGSSQEDSSDYEEYSEQEPLYYPADSIEAIRRLRDYAYMANLDSVLRNLHADVNENDQGPSKSIFDIGLIKALVWGLAIFSVLFLLYQLFAGQQSLFAKNKKLETYMMEEEKSQSSLSPLILSQQAAARSDYRQAVRYHYAYILQLMGEKHFIKTLPQKTNDQYLKEVRQKPFASDFAKLTLQYEYVWYGEFQLNKNQFETIEGGYRKFIATWL